MMIIWDHIIKSFQDFKVFREKRRNQIIQIRCSKEDILHKLKRFAPSNPNCIKKEWVSKALQGFEDLDLAFKINNEDYDVYLKKHKGSTRDFFFQIN